MALNDSFETILNRILTDYRNQDNTIDTAKGSLPFINAAALASAIWGLNKDGLYVDAQRFADTCDEETLDHYITLRLPVILSETLADKRARVLSDIRTPPAGGNQYDYRRWAKEASADVAEAWCVPLGQGPGTVDVVILAAVSTGSEIPLDALLATVRAYIVDICPSDVKYLRVLAPQVITENVTIVRQGSDYPASSAITDITNYLASFIPGQPLYRDQLKGNALGGGDGAAPVTLPAGDVTPTPYQMIRPGIINVT